MSRFISLLLVFLGLALSNCSTSNDIEFNNVRLEKPVITGEIINTSDQKYRIVIVDFHVFDDSNKMIHNYVETFQDLNPKERRLFSVVVYEQNAVHVKVKGILHKEKAE